MKKFFALVTFLLILSAQASAMNLTIYRDADWTIGLSSEPFTLKIAGYTNLDGDFSKGVAQFGNLYYHFDALALRDKMPLAKSFEEEEKIFAYASRFGGRDFANTVPVYTFEGGTRIYPIKSDDAREFYMLVTETGGGGSIKVIGERDGKWVRYFDTQDLHKSKQIGWDFYLQNFYTDGDTIIFIYEQGETRTIRELRYKWDEAAQWFGVEIR